MKYAIITISKKDAEACKKYLNNVILTEDDTIIWTANFGDGMEMDVKVCGADYETAWTEAVLFKNGYEVCCTDCYDELVGEWSLEYNDETYIANVIIEN